MRDTTAREGGAPYDGGPQLALPALTPVTRLLLLVNAGVFAAGFLLWLAGAWTWPERLLGLSVGLWEEWFPFPPVWQLVTYGFLHSVRDPMHVLWNSLLLYFFGTMLEGLIGSRRFGVLYGAAMICGALAHLVAGSLFGGAGGVALGASGAVLGVVVAAAALRPQAQVLVLFIPVRLWFMAVMIVGFDLFAVLASLRVGAGDGVAHWVHLGGAAWGFAAVRTGWIHRDPLHALQRRRKVALSERRRTDDERMDRLLEKIHREGMGSLTRSEREFLKRVSSRG
ncbi:MAG: rhomboid family intramembrane serine protease [Planctomycetota bacterium]|nr:rhomboid family intramembrane serine protease [Planctomycetota bacterium]